MNSQIMSFVMRCRKLITEAHNDFIANAVVKMQKGFACVARNFGDK